jgi:hypothetical protein
VRVFTIALATALQDAGVVYVHAAQLGPAE